MPHSKGKHRTHFVDYNKDGIITGAEFTRANYGRDREPLDRAAEQVEDLRQRRRYEQELEEIRWKQHDRKMKKNFPEIYEPKSEDTAGFYERMDKLTESGNAKKKKQSKVVAVTILALFGMYLFSLQGSSDATAYCIANTNILVGGLTLILLVVLLILIKTAFFTKEIIKYVPVPVKTKARRKPKKVKRKK